MGRKILLCMLLLAACNGPDGQPAPAGVAAVANADAPTATWTPHPPADPTTTAVVATVTAPPATNTPVPAVGPTSPDSEPASANHQPTATAVPASDTAVPPTATPTPVLYGRDENGAYFYGHPDAPVVLLDYSDFL